jgi:nitroreductase
MNVKETIEKRRAYRNIAPVPVTEDLLKDLAECASLAPSCFNNQPWRFAFVHEHRELEKFKSVLSAGNEWAFQASMYIVVFSKPDLDCRIKGRDYFLFDTGMALAFMILRATELGFVIHPIAGFDPEKVRELLNIPGDMTIITVAVFGEKLPGTSDVLNEKQKASEEIRPERLPLEKISFNEKYSE